VRLLTERTLQNRELLAFGKICGAKETSKMGNKILAFI